MIIKVAKRVENIKEYYFSIKLREVELMRKQGADVINLGIGSPDLAPDSSVIEALYTSAQNAKNHGYQSYKGSQALREAIAVFYQSTYNVTLDPNTEILPLIGSKEGITHISLTFLNEGDTVLVPDLGYPAYTSVSQMCHATIQEFPLLDKDWQPDFEFLEGLPTNDRTKLLWLNYPNMPTGAPAQRATFEKAVQWAKDKKVLLCHDNPYSLVLNTTKPMSIFSVEGAKEVAVELNSMSKSQNMAGWRIGWVCGKKEYIDAILKIKSNVDSGMFLPIQEAAVAALQLPLDWHTKRNEIYTVRREAVFAVMDKLGCHYQANQEGLFVWGKLPEGLHAEQFIDDILQQYHIFITPGSIFGSKGDGYIRISLCAETERIKEALQRLNK